MSVKLKDLSPEQLKALRELALKKVNRKIKSAEERHNKERQWADEQLVDDSTKIQNKEQDKVPVKIDSRTTIMVKRDKCVQQADGSWIKK